MKDTGGPQNVTKLLKELDRTAALFGGYRSKTFDLERHQISREDLGTGELS